MNEDEKLYVKMASAVARFAELLDAEYAEQINRETGKGNDNENRD